MRNGEKGTYGRLSSGTDGSNNNKGGGHKKQPRRSPRRSSSNISSNNNNNSNGNGNGNGNNNNNTTGSSRKKGKTSNQIDSLFSSGKKKPPSASKKKKPKTLSANTKPSSKAISKASSKASSKNSKKSPPKSKHHTAKHHTARNSIKERVASAAAAKKKNNPSSSSFRNSSRDRNPSRERNPSRDGDGRRVDHHRRSSSSSSSSRRKKKRVQYRMSLSECNDDVYLLTKDVPWGGAAANANDDSDDDSDGDDDDDDDSRSDSSDEEKVAKNDSKNNTSTTPKMPSRRILRSMDAELSTFGTYVGLTPSERDARISFLNHVSEIAASQFDTVSVRGISAPRGMGTANRFYLGGGGNAAESINEFDDDEEEICVAPFGSFATERVCTFMSDVDMCLWGVVKGARRPRGGESYVGDTGEGDDDDEEGDGGDGDDGEEPAVALEVSECPLLTESSVLRTMDAIRSAAAAAAGEGGNRPATHVAADAETENAGEEEGDCLFVIDRVGDGSAGEQNAKSDVEVIDPSTDKPKNGNEKRDAVAAVLAGGKTEVTKVDEEYADEAEAATKDTTSAEDFQFVMDSESAKELGGEIVDLTESPDADRIALAKSNREIKKSPEEPVVGPANTESGVRPKNDNREEDKRQRTEGETSPDRHETAFSCTNFRNSTANMADEWDSESCGPAESDEDSRDAIDGGNARIDSNKKEVINVDEDEDDDSADKMSAYYSRQGGAAIGTRTNSAEREIIEIDAPSRASSPVDLIDDDDSSLEADEGRDRADDDDGVLELSLTTESRKDATTTKRPFGHFETQRPPVKKQVVGPTGKTRARVLSALQILTRQLRRSSFTHTIECRSRARVPIINCGTRTGFEGDIAIGGHNGVDTSTYAMDQVKRFDSFAPIVLFLKVLMAQQGFDKPFTGGLGSYKLYVLVAYHLERHLANGGMDHPSEVLISLLFRYGCIGTRYDKTTTTDLEWFQKSEDLIHSDGGMCELTPVFRLSDCVDMFRECHARLFDRIDVADDHDEKISYLSCMIDCYRLNEARETSVRRSKLCDDINRPTPRDHPGKVSSGRRIGKVFTKGSGAVQSSLKRGPRGGIVPKKRPDLQAKHSLRNNRDAEITQRGVKNRNNNKKQKRDEALRSFASRNSI